GGEQDRCCIECDPEGEEEPCPVDFGSWDVPPDPGLTPFNPNVPPGDVSPSAEPAEEGGKKKHKKKDKEPKPAE
ncbi:MAG: hypothetical protein AB1758_37555, partial [Candidatus Eremiobacterota bacterium]